VKVALLRAGQQGASTAPDADALLALAERHLDAGRVRLVLVGGAPGTGKTTLAKGLAEERGWVLLRSDEARKQLAGLAATTRAVHPLDAGIYGPTMTALTYGELLHHTEQLLRRGETVVLDATWADAAWRDEARRVADRNDAELVAFRCVAPVAVAVQRVATRLPAGGDASDATPEVARAVAERFSPWADATEVDTSGPADSALRAASQLAAS